jgi:hypothetical protein
MEGKGGGSDENRVHGMMVQVVLAAEQYKGVAGGSFKITLARPSLSFAQDLLHEICSGNPAHAENLKVVLLSRDPTNLRSELSSNKKVCCQIFWSVVLQAVCKVFYMSVCHQYPMLQWCLLLTPISWSTNLHHH